MMDEPIDAKPQVIIDANLERLLKICGKDVEDHIVDVGDFITHQKPN